MSTQESTDLVLVTAQNAVQIFTGGGMAAILDGIEAKVRLIPLDPSSDEGRDKIRSVAYQIARTKAALDAEGKKLTEGWREATSKVNAERKKSAERLEALQEEIRQPLTDFENKEKRRVEAHENALRDITGMHAMLSAYPTLTLQQLLEHQGDLAAMLPGYAWEEFQQRASVARAECSKYLTARIDERRKLEAEQAELGRLRQEEAERVQRVRDEKLRIDAAEKARTQAELKAKADADAEAKRVFLAAEKEHKRVADEADRVRLEHEKAQKAAEDARRKEESEKIAAQDRADKAERTMVAAEKKAKQEIRAAIEREREAVERKRVANEAEKAKRESDDNLRRKVRQEIIDDLYAGGLSMDGKPERVYDLILAGQVRHVEVKF